MSIKIGVVSDLHLDMFIPVSKGDSVKKIKKFAKDLVKDSNIDAIVIAGDTSHYNLQILTLCVELNTLGIEVFITYGNHEFYNVSRSQEVTYRGTFSKVTELKELLAPLPNTHLLDGDIVEFKGVTFGGACGWYDGTSLGYNPYGSSPDTILFSYSNDSRRIPKYKSMYDIVAVESPKVQKVALECDIMVTHICPSVDPKFIIDEFKAEPSNCLYTFSGDQLIEDTKAKFWIYGHMHTYDEQEHLGAILIRNPRGYPKERNNFKLKVIEI